MRSPIVSITYEITAAAPRMPVGGGVASLAAKRLLRRPDIFSRQPSRLLR